MTNLNESAPTTLLLATLLLATANTFGSDCDNTSIDRVPLIDLGSGMYLGQFEGGLYPGGSNTAPAQHHAEGVRRGAAIVPRNPNGEPDPAGSYVLLSIGMSNAGYEFCSESNVEPCDPWSFAGQAAAHVDVNHDQLAIVNGAWNGLPTPAWESPTSQGYGLITDVLERKGLSDLQVQAIWFKTANASPSIGLPAASADAYDLELRSGNVMRTLRERYPNLQIVLVSSRIYAGYATSDLNREPYAYESGFAMKWLIEAQIEQMAGRGIDPVAGDLGLDVAPWIAWGPYLWADGLVPRSDGLVWACSDFSGDGTHPAVPGRATVAHELLQHLLTSPYASSWFASSPGPSADVTGDGVVDVQDLLVILASWGPCTPPASCAADLDGDGLVGVNDLLVVLGAWG